MTRQSLVSIVIPCYNLGQYVEEALLSVELQTYGNVEIIIVDDGSSDTKTKEVISRLQKQRSIRVIRQKNQGLSSARNNGINASRGDFYVCLDADDKLDPEYIEKTMKQMTSSRKDCAFVTTWLQEFGERTDIWKTSKYDPMRLLSENIIHAGSLVRKRVWEEVGGYKSVMIGGLEDWEFWINIVSRGYIWDVVEEPLFMYRVRHDSMLRAFEDRHNELYRKIVELHSSYFASNLISYAQQLMSTNKDLRMKCGETQRSLAQIHTRNNDLGIENDRLEEDLHLESVSRLAAEARYNKLESRLLVKILLLVRRIQIKVSNVRRAQTLRFRNFTSKVIRCIYTRFTPQLIKLKLRKVRAMYDFKKVQYVDLINKKYDIKLPLVSIVITYFNRSDTIDETLESLANQTFNDFEVIIVNDGSTNEKCVTYFQELRKKHPSYKFIEQANGGVASARNRGIFDSRGKYILSLDSDDCVTERYVEMCVYYLEAHPEHSFVYSDVQTFGASGEVHIKSDFDALNLISDNMVTSATMFKRSAWEEVGGYKSGIGYEDWEFWINLAEHGHTAGRIPEKLFLYRVAPESRYKDDLKKHSDNVMAISTLHPKYRKVVSGFEKRHRHDVVRYPDRDMYFVNLNRAIQFSSGNKDKPNVLLVLPWMTFGGAETLILNFCNELNDEYNIHFITGLKSSNEWEYKFKDLSKHIYHIPHIHNGDDYLLGFINNYLTTHDIKLIHIIHTSVVFGVINNINKSKTKILMTVFNDRAHFHESIKVSNYIDAYSTDNMAVGDHFSRVLGLGKKIDVIPNGVNSETIYNPKLFNSSEVRSELSLAEDHVAIFFIGRLSEEKNPNVFIEVAKKLRNTHPKARFFIIGDGPMRDEIVAESKGLDNVTYLGYREDIARDLSAADIFVLPSAIEGFPLSILEAMAMGVAVIASDVGAVSDVVENQVDGFIVKPGSGVEIANVIRRLLADREQLVRVRSCARAKVETKYSNTILGENYKKLYRSILG